VALGVSSMRVSPTSAAAEWVSDLLSRSPVHTMCPTTWQRIGQWILHSYLFLTKEL